MTTLYNKQKYVLHYRILKKDFEQGLKLSKVRRGILFQQSKWMEPYIMLNTQYRMEAKNEFEEDFFKLMSNAVFGKAMQNVRKMRDIRLATTLMYYLYGLALKSCMFLRCPILSTAHIEWG